MRTRPARPDDIPAITALQGAEDEFWFGAAEFDEDEIREEFEPVEDLSTQSVLIFDDAPEYDAGDDPLVGAGWWWGGTQTFLVAAQGPRRTAVIDLLLDTAGGAGVPLLFCLARDTEFVDAITAHGWRHTYSSFDLFRAVESTWTLPEPSPPAGVEFGSLHDDELSALHTLIYDDARWADVPGHVRREFREWKTIFWRPGPDSATFVARRDGRMVGAVITRTYSDGTGMISQLAVSHSEQRGGLGRALLLAGLRNRRDAGATRLGLGVQAANRHALALYESVGLRIEREYGIFERPA